MSRIAMVLALATAAGCGGKSSPAPVAPLPDDGPTTGSTERPAPEPAEPAPPPTPQPVVIEIPARSTQVKLVKPGKGKKATLRYTLAAGVTQRFELIAQLSADMAGNQMVTPELHATYARDIVAIGDDGVATVRYTLEAVDATDAAGQTAPTETVEAALADFVGLTIETTMTPQGVFGAQTITLPRGGDPQILQMLAPSMIVLPAEKVGDGAIWQIETAAAGNFEAAVTTKLTLSKRKGDVASVTGKTTVEAGPQTVTERGATAQIESFKGSETMKVDVDLARALAIGTVETARTMRISGGGQTSDVKTTGKTRIVVP
jgi:hypothetical protein